MKIDTFRKKLVKVINEDEKGRFLAEDNRQSWYEKMHDDEIVVVGESHRQVFLVQIFKVYEDDEIVEIVNKKGKII